MLTPRQSRCLDLICRAVAAGRPPPTYRELVRAMGLRSIGHVAAVMESLRSRGFIRQVFGQKRSTEPLRWPDGTRFAAEDGWRLAALIAAYEGGRLATGGAACPYLGQQGEAWRLGAAAGARP